ncbi:preprotein translocase subunit SecA [Candidatus Babeliales bacterium]|nr:preprotein translocase subunit SecA [Candidatus Babeliales bacterium]
MSNILAKLFGTKNERELKRYRQVVKKINSLEESIIALTDLELTAKTNEFRERIFNGKTLDQILPEAFAVVRETAKRKLGERHYDVQLIGGMVLHEGRISEMKTGEGKTLVSTLPLYLNALSGKGVHLVTVNDYLARRDGEWMRPIYNHLGLEVGILQNDMSDEDRKKAYQADITYGTNNEYGFDYLRDNMKFDLEQYVQKDLNYAIVDEVDSILIDEARTPLIISGASYKGSDLYGAADYATKSLKKDIDYEVDEKARTVHFTESGIDKIESALEVQNIYAPENLLALHHATQALKAHSLFKKDVDYVVKDGEVLIVDEFTGRILGGRRYSDGLHQAIEAKEGVKVEAENQTLASITLQNYFRIYNKLAGMTGTAETEAQEFYNIYKLEVTAIPTHKPLARKDEPDAIFLDNKDKFEAIIKDIKDCYEKGQPVLVGTIAIESSELLSALLLQQNIPHNVLNAKQHQREAEIIKTAGEKSNITIATNMAGRGTDIKLGKGVREVGGLRIIGTERHESRRIDNQLRGRAGRQGDPGSSKFYLSLEDDLMRIFGGERMKNMMVRIGMEKGESIEHKMVSRSIEKAQEKVEKHNFEIRKNLLEYDDVLNQQRTVIYDYRREILDGTNKTQELIKEIIRDITSSIIPIYCPQKNCSNESLSELLKSLEGLTGLEQKVFEKNNLDTSTTELTKNIIDLLCYEYEQLRSKLPEDIVGEAEKWILLQTIDEAWKINLLSLDKLKEGIGLRAYGQKNPIIEYKKEAYHAFETMMKQIKWDIIQRIYKLRPEHFSAESIEEIEREKMRELEEVEASHRATGDEKRTPKKRISEKIGRNDPCPCGSGKKYKKCCGK